jgi:AraC family transcriptional regulator
VFKLAKTADELKRKQCRDAYTAGINRAVDYIEGDIDGQLSLDKISSKAGFSKFHFHRLFAAMTGETLNRFVQRIRVERAASKLKSNPGESITEIAFDCGFSGSAAFARVFKDYFGMSAGEWRERGYPDESKIRKTFSNFRETISNNRKEYRVSICHFGDATTNPEWRIEMTERGLKGVRPVLLTFLNQLLLLPSHFSSDQHSVSLLFYLPPRG